MPYTSNPYLQRRFLVGFEERKLPHIFTDILVIGGGAAGMCAAMAAADYGEVIVLAKGEETGSNTFYAQGGLAAAIAADDTCDEHIADTIETGKGMCDETVVRECLGAAPDYIDRLRGYGVLFDSDGDGLSLAREGGHRKARVIHGEGDSTGRIIIESLLPLVKSRGNVKVFDNCFALDILTSPLRGGPGSKCIGVLTDHPRFGMQIIVAAKTILATGGAGMLWRETTNPPCATGDGLAMAFRAGAALADMELMQFHPTTLYVAGAGRFLISEAVRGEGGRLLDRNGNRFMQKYHDMLELAPRDVVSRAIVDQMQQSGGSPVYIDVRHIGRDDFAARFPTIYRKCFDFDIDPGKDLIPVHPSAHYMIGGVRVDSCCRTGIGELWCCGEASCTGLHGANRLASNSITEAIVFGHRCGGMAGESLEGNGGARPAYIGDMNWELEPSDRTELDLADIRNSLRSVMWKNVGILRNGPRLAETMEIIDFWGRYVLDKEFCSDHEGWQIQNMLTVGRLVTEMAMLRTETRGVHCREDFPETNAAWARHQTVRRTDNQLVVE